MSELGQFPLLGLGTFQQGAGAGKSSLSSKIGGACSHGTSDILWINEGVYLQKCLGKCNMSGGKDGLELTESIEWAR